jgi:hypothetical protein
MRIVTNKAEWVFLSDESFLAFVTPDALPLIDGLSAFPSGSLYLFADYDEN